MKKYLLSLLLVTSMFHHSEGASYKPMIQKCITLLVGFFASNCLANSCHSHPARVRSLAITALLCIINTAIAKNNVVELDTLDPRTWYKYLSKDCLLIGTGAHIVLRSAQENAHLGDSSTWRPFRLFNYFGV